MNLLPLHGYIRQALGASAPLQAKIGQRIFERVPGNGTFPYVTLEVGEILDESLLCLDQWVALAKVHIWSRAVGSPEAKEIAALCHAALAERWPVFSGYRVSWFKPVDQIWIADTDGLTSHGVLQFESRYGPED